MHIIHCRNKLNQVTIIDIDTMKDRQDNYCTLSGTDFKTDWPVSEDFFIKPEIPVEIIEEEGELAEPTEVTEDNGMQALRDQYEEVMGKAVPVRYKNDAGWISNKIQETLTPAK